MPDTTPNSTQNSTTSSTTSTVTNYTSIRNNTGSDKYEESDTNNAYTWLMENHGNNPLGNFNFVLRVEALYDLACKGIKGIHREFEYDYIQEGGLNDYVHMKRKPISKPNTFQVERYCGLDLFDPLTLGTELTLPVILFVNRRNLKWAFGRIYMFTGCVVTAKDYGDLNAESSGLLVETTTIAYKHMVCIDTQNQAMDLFGDLFGTEPNWDINNPDKERSYQQGFANTTWEKAMNEKYYDPQKDPKKQTARSVYQYSINDKHKPSYAASYTPTSPVKKTTKDQAPKMTPYQYEINDEHVREYGEEYTDVGTGNIVPPTSPVKRTTMDKNGKDVPYQYVINDKNARVYGEEYKDEKSGKIIPPTSPVKTTGKDKKPQNTPYQYEIKKGTDSEKSPVRTTGLDKNGKEVPYQYEINEKHTRKYGEEYKDAETGKVVAPTSPIKTTGVDKKPQETPYQYDINKGRDSEKSPVRTAGVKEMSYREMQEKAKANGYPVKINARQITDYLKK